MDLEVTAIVVENVLEQIIEDVDFLIELEVGKVPYRAILHYNNISKINF